MESSKRETKRNIWGTCIYEFKGEEGRDWEERRVEKKTVGKRRGKDNTNGDEEGLTGMKEN